MRLARPANIHLLAYLLSKLSASLSEMGSELMLICAGAFLEMMGKSPAEEAILGKISQK